jgi:acylphosphatase
MIQAKHYVVRGHVQGVGYRWFAQRAARRLEVVGYVRNLSSGEVEVRAQADGSVLELFKQELERGPQGASVREVIEKDSPLRDTYRSFDIA